MTSPEKEECQIRIKTNGVRRDISVPENADKNKVPVALPGGW